MQQSNICTLILFILLQLSSCQKQWGDTEEIETCTTYAGLLKMQKLEEGVTVCRIMNPWVNYDEALAQYLLVTDSIADFDEGKLNAMEKRLGKCEIIRTPLRRNALGNACHGYLLHQLGAVENIAVMCETEYVSFRPIKEIIEAGKILEGGSAMSPNIETILSNGCDAIWLSPFESQLSTLSSQPLTNNIPIIFTADYMELSTLGRAEWMKFYGALVGKEAEADSLFALVERNYMAEKEFYKEDPIGEDNRKKILVETPYQGTWYVPGGCSTMSELYKVAGYHYHWEDDSHSGSLALSPEAVLYFSQDADIWLVKYYAEQDYSLEEFLSQNPLFMQFKAAQDKEVYGCNTKYSDFYDVTPFRPDLLLKDLKNPGEGYFKKLR